MANINKKDLVKILSDKTDIPQTKILSILDTMIDEIKIQFQQGNIIKLRNFGTFYPYYKKSRTYIMPRLLKEREMKSRTTLKFKPSREILIYDE